MLGHNEAYKAAIETHRYYDNVSLTVVGSMFAVAYGCFALFKDSRAAPIFILGAGVVVMLWLVYERLLGFADHASNEAMRLEQHLEPVGGEASAVEQALNQRPVGVRNALNSSSQRLKAPRLRTSVRWLSIGLTAMLATAPLWVPKPMPAPASIGSASIAIGNTADAQAPTKASPQSLPAPLPHPAPAVRAPSERPPR